MLRLGAALPAVVSSLVFSNACNYYLSARGQDCPSSARAPEYSTGEEKVTITQGAWGDIRYWEGDFMPKVSSAQNPCPQSSGTIRNVKREVLVYPLINPSANPAAVQTSILGPPFYMTRLTSP